MASLNSNISLNCSNWEEFAKQFSPATEGQDLTCDVTTLLFLIQKLQPQNNSNLQIAISSSRSGYSSVISNAFQAISTEQTVSIIEFVNGAESKTQIGSASWQTLHPDKLLETVTPNTSLIVFFGEIQPSILQHVLNCGIPCAQVFSGSTLEDPATAKALAALKTCYAQVTLEPQQNPFSWNHINSYYTVFRGRNAACKRAIVVGDVHGCLDELQLLLSKCQFNPEHDELIMVGDLCGKGPKSKELLQFLRDTKAKAVLGNHDVHTMACHTKKVNGLPYYLVLDRFSTIVVHAGLLPDVHLDKQDPINMTYMRNILEDGKASKEATHGAPWASLWKGPYHVIFGHDAVRGLQKYPYATGLDTGCCYGGALTACVLPAKKLVSVPALKMYSVPT
eukprot:CAMPEP_0168548986 /NCGR_PEP_ID=MMETSP0413-20121227/4861_1 /TAXON_ID=136452 /ORGANISM="Filamoeba nolandi, Strain NC-AS-23-1" /LENGTH=392 /DNA_ID=CAMNT_0008579341 /DNA_START=1 /DNA_END=1175 /DNA_ORIENTATION=+